MSTRTIDGPELRAKNAARRAAIAAKSWVVPGRSEKESDREPKRRRSTTVRTWAWTR